MVRLIYEILSDEEFLKLDREGWSWSGDLGQFECTVGSALPPVVANASAALAGEAPAASPTEIGPTLVASPRFRETSIPRVRAMLEELLSAWTAHLEITDRIAIRFEYRGAWIMDPTSDAQPSLAEWAAAGGGSFRVFNQLREVPALPPAWMTREPELVRLLREQWRGVRSGQAKLLDRAYFCLTAIEAAYGGRKDAADTLRVSAAVLSRIGRLAASSDPQHARKMTGSGATTFSHEDWAWLNAAIPRLILRCAEVELAVADLQELTAADFD